MSIKIAMTGTSGSGKSTLANYIAERFNLKFISGSAGDIKGLKAEKEMAENFGIQPNLGHSEVIKNSAKDFLYGLSNQTLIQRKRAEMIKANDYFITDRSPLDNFTYFVNQLGFHKECTDEVVKQFKYRCLEAWKDLTHVIYIKPCQPEGVEDNGSRVANKYYQHAIDAQFEYWLGHIFKNKDRYGQYINNYWPNILVIDYWDLEKRKAEISFFLTKTSIEAWNKLYGREAGERLKG